MAKAMQAPYGLMREFLEEHNYISSSNLGGGTTLRLGLPTGSTSLGADSGGTSIDTSAGSSRVSSCGSTSHFRARLWWSISMHSGLSLQESHVSTRQYPEHNSCLDVILQAPDIISWWHLKITHLPTGLSTVLSTVAKRPKLDHWSTCRVQMSPSVGEQKCPAGHLQQVKSWHPPPGVPTYLQSSWQVLLCCRKRSCSKKTFLLKIRDRTPLDNKQTIKKICKD